MELLFWKSLWKWSTFMLTLTLLNATECTNSKKLMQIVALSRQGIFARLMHSLAFSRRGVCYTTWILLRNSRIPHCILLHLLHGSCLGTLHSVAFSRVLRESPVGVRVNVQKSLVNGLTVRRSWCFHPIKICIIIGNIVCDGCVGHHWSNSHVIESL